MSIDNQIQLNKRTLEKKVKKVWVYDIESLSNFFSIYFLDRDSNENRLFVVHESRNDFIDLIIFLYDECQGLIGFNNLNYDYPLLHKIINEIQENFTNHLEDGNYIAKIIYEASTRIIASERSQIWDNQIMIPQMDLMRIHHLDNKSKRRSLKDIEVVIQFPNVEDMPIHHSSTVYSKDIPDIISYNMNDVKATKAFYQQTIPDVKLRLDLLNQFGLDFMNANDPKIGSEILLHYICNYNNWSINEIRQVRNNVSQIRIGDYIFPYINFSNKLFNEILEKYKKHVMIVDDPSTNPKFSIIYRNIKYEYGIGGLHACCKSGIYEKTEDEDIEDIDVAGFYPAIAVENNIYPEHLGPSFGRIYSERYHYRLKIKPDKTKKAEAGLWKLALNGVSGKVDDKYSYLYDPTYAIKVKINGQLMLSMAIEAVLENTDATLLQANTDGFTIKIRKDQKPIMYEVLKEWEQTTKLVLEYSNYRRMIIRDVNSYIGIYDKDQNDLYAQFPDSEIYDNNYSYQKTKGAFQVIPEANGRVVFWKKWDSRIIQKAVHDYFVHDTPIQNTIHNSTNVFDFYRSYKNTKGWSTLYIKPDSNEDMLSKTTRYYMSVNGGRLYKKHADGRKNAVEATGRVTIANKHVDKKMKDYKIDYSWYIREANKLIFAVLNNGQILLDL